MSIDALAAAGRLFGSTAAANFLLVGVAYQAGAIPISAAAIEEAIAINGVAVQANQLAFRWGRAAVADPTAFQTAPAPDAAAQHFAPVVPSHLFDGCPVTGSVRDLLERRAADLVAYQGDRVATRLIDLAQHAWTQECAVSDRSELSEAVVRNFFKLLAYKDEYEVARMLTDPEFIRYVDTQVPGAANLTYKLHPPTLKALGRTKKIGLGPRTHFVLRLLAKGKFLRGSVFDPFGYARMRRIERELVTHYEVTVKKLLQSLTPESYDKALGIAAAPELIRGYEEVKMDSVERYVSRLKELGVDIAPLSR